MFDGLVVLNCLLVAKLIHKVKHKRYCADVKLSLSAPINFVQKLCAFLERGVKLKL